MSAVRKDTGLLVQFSVKVTDAGKVLFDSSISHPLLLPPEQAQQAGEAWHEMMLAGLKFGRAITEEVP